MKTEKRGRPRKNIENIKEVVKVTTVKMDNLDFNPKLFEPMKTKTRIDQFFSSDGGLMPGVNLIITGDPGIGKTTLLLDVLSDLQATGKKCLFISGEMNAIDMHGYVKRFPKFGDLDILFMSDYSEANPDIVLRTAFKEGYDVILVDSMMEVADMYTDYFGGTNKSNSSKLLQLFEEHNLAGNDEKLNTSFLIIQQVTKAGHFAGSNKLKHLTTGMMCMKFEDDLRYLHFEKNRRGGNMNRLYFNLSGGGKVEYLHESPVNRI